MKNIIEMQELGKHYLNRSKSCIDSNTVLSAMYQEASKVCYLAARKLLGIE